MIKRWNSIGADIPGNSIINSSLGPRPSFFGININVDNYEKANYTLS